MNENQEQVLRQRIRDGATDIERFEAVIDVLAGMARDINDTKHTVEQIQTDIMPITQLYNGFIVGQKVFVGAAVVIGALATIGSACIYLFNEFLRAKP